jgi:hypothetical protein
MPNGTGAEATQAIQIHHSQAAEIAPKDPYSKAGSDAAAYPNPQAHSEVVWSPAAELEPF